MKYLLAFIACINLIIVCQPVLAHTCNNGNCMTMQSSSCEKFFIESGRSECKSICSLNANDLCEGFVKRFFDDGDIHPGGLNKSNDLICTDGNYKDIDNGWVIKFVRRSSANSMHYDAMIAGPSHLLKNYAKPNFFAVPAEKYRMLISLRPTWRFHYIPIVQLYSQELNKKGIEELLSMGSQDTRLITDKMKPGKISNDVYLNLEDRIDMSVSRFLEKDLFSACDAYTR